MISKPLAKSVPSEQKESKSWRNTREWLPPSARKLLTSKDAQVKLTEQQRAELQKECRWLIKRLNNFPTKLSAFGNKSLALLKDAAKALESSPIINERKLIVIDATIVRLAEERKMALLYYCSYRFPGLV